MDPNEEPKPTSRRVHPEQQPNHVDADFALAMQLQEQDQSTLDNIESSESEEDDDDDDQTYTVDGYEFFDSLGIDEDLGFLEDEEGSAELEMEEDEEDDIDPDELSYEELIVLGEVIRVERRGASEKEISGRLRAGKWEKESRGIDRCVVCQMEYEQEEQVVALPGCQHPYHFECISKWLHLKNIFPICSHQPI